MSKVNVVKKSQLVLITKPEELKTLGMVKSQKSKASLKSKGLDKHSLEIKVKGSREVRICKAEFSKGKRLAN